MLNIGLVGVKRGAMIHALGQRKDVRFTAVCDTAFADGEARTAFEQDDTWQQAGVTFDTLYDDYDAFLKHDLDAVIIASPPMVHAAQSIAALKSGRHVLSEVPAVMTVNEARDLVAAVRSATGRYFFMENCCYWAFVAAWKAMVEQGRLGELFYAEGDYIHSIPELFADQAGNRTWRYDFEAIRYVTHETGPLLDLLDTRGASVTAMASSAGPMPNTMVRPMLPRHW